MTRPHADRLAGPCRCRKPTGKFCADSKNIGSNTPIPVVTLTRDDAASKTPAAVTPRDHRVRLTGPGQVVAVTLLRCAGASGLTCRARASS